jgi:hypothetical protein|tara:strand:+ start:21264 stop:21860 length:597 start_codon:yes stop_codon:yes gene_type:complete
MKMRFAAALVCMATLIGCTPIAKPPVLDASWRASADDRVIKSGKIKTKKSQVSIQRDRTEKNLVVPIEPMAKIEAIDQPKEYEISPAVLSLLDQADQLQNAGDLIGASSRLQRAQRIAPTEPEIYFQLSNLRLAQGALGDAVNVATQGVGFAGTDSAMKRDLYTVIARAQDGLGDSVSATEARRLSRSFGSQSEAKLN